MSTTTFTPLWTFCLVGFWGVCFFFFLKQDYKSQRKLLLFSILKRKIVTQKGDVKSPDSLSRQVEKNRKDLEFQANACKPHSCSACVIRFSLQPTRMFLCQSSGAAGRDQPQRWSMCSSEKKKKTQSLFKSSWLLPLCLSSPVCEWLYMNVWFTGSGQN